MPKIKLKRFKSPLRNKRSLGKFSLTFRLSLGITVLITLLMAAVGYATFMRDSNTLLKEAYSRGWSTVNTISTAAADRQYREEPTQLNKLLAAAAQDQLVRFAVLLNNNYSVLAHNDSKLVGSGLENDQLKEAVQQNHKVTAFQYDHNGKPDLITFTAPVKDIAGQTIGYIYLGQDLTYLNKHLEDAVQNIIYNCVLAVIAGMLLTRLLIIRVVGRPVKALVGATEKVATGDFSGQIPVQNMDELGKLASSFNTMTGHLGILFHSIRNTVTDMTHAAQLIVKRSELNREDLPREALLEIKTAAKRLVRMSDKLNSLSRQFKTTEQAEKGA